MKIKKSEFLQNLRRDKEEIIEKVKNISTLEDSQIQWREQEESWNILECVEHLNLYGDFYIPEIKKAIQKKKLTSEEYFKPGFLGNYFSNSMLPDNKMSKMKTFKDKNPLGESLGRNVFKRFLDQQEDFLGLYNAANDISLNKTKTSISISSLIKLKIGDTFAFLLNHEKRHLKQMENILESFKRVKGATNDTLLQA